MKNFIVKGLLAIRRWKYGFYSNNRNVQGTYRAHQPVVIRGKGNISFGKNVHIGVINSPHFYNAYAYIEARTETAEIHFGSDVHINNGFSIVSEKSIHIGDEVLIGFNCHIIDSSFHNIAIDRRKETDPDPQSVIIERNVFIGNNVTILKGVTIGENSVVANGAVVTTSCSKNTIIAGVPAKEIKKIT